MRRDAKTALDEIVERLARLQQQAEAAGLERLAELIRAARTEAESARQRERS